MIKAWVLVVLLNGTYVDQGPRMTYNQCMAELKKYVSNKPEMKDKTRCEWRDL